MIYRRLLALLALLLLLPGTAAAAPQPISLADYQSMLRHGISHLEKAERYGAANPTGAIPEIDAAKPYLKGTWLVQGPHGDAAADLTPVATLLDRAGPTLTEPRANLSRALALAKDHLAAAEALGTAQPITAPEARKTLEDALEATKARTVLQRIQEWLRNLFLRPVEEGASRVFQAPPWVYWLGGSIAFLALTWIGISLYRSLSGHAAPGEATLSQALAGHPDRPTTPAELRALARQLAERGEHLEGLRAAHLALLRQYDAIGLIRYVPALTNREHERQLRRQLPDLAQQFRTLNDLVDDRLYSGHGASIEDFLTVDGLVDQLWREGDAISRSAEAIPGRSSSASSR